MAEHDDEREAARRYRELPREEPPPALDARIRAAALGAAAEDSRRAAVTHPAPLVVPTGRRRWYFPVAAAAVIVLAVAVTWQVERAQPDSAASDDFLYKRSEEPAPAASSRAPEAPEGKSARPRAQRDAAPKELVARSKSAPQSSIGIRGSTVEPAAPPAERPAPAAEAPLAATEAEKRAQIESATSAIAQRQADVAAAPSAAEANRDRRMAESAPSPQAPQAVQRPAPKPQAGAQVRAQVEARPLQGLGLDEAPAPWLERIAQLRQQGKHDEADKALAEFRKRYPDYRIPEAMLEKVEKK